jgi:hypothetical protein
MQISERQRNWCLNLITHLFRWKLTAFFRRPVDPHDDDLPGYSEKVSRPMDLETVRRTLLDGHYADVPSFLSDLRLIWENTKAYYGTESVMGFISDEILQYIDREEEYASLTPDQVWFRKLTAIQKKIDAHVQKKHPSLNGKS